MCIYSDWKQLFLLSGASTLFLIETENSLFFYFNFVQDQQRAKIISS